MKDEITYLFVPANKKDFFPKALASGADAIILDLEDSVHPSEKTSGRENIINWFREVKLKENTGHIYIRINNPESEYFSHDVKMLETISGSLLKGIFIPKLEQNDSIRKIKKILPEYLKNIIMIGIIETARGLHHCESIAESGISRMAFGSLDFSLDINCQQSQEALLYARSRIVIASRIADLPAPIDCVTPEFNSSEMLAEESLHGSSLGFGAKLCIHPDQVSVISGIYSPSEDKTEWAKKVIQQSNGNYAFKIDGSMVDLPLIKIAARILEREKNIHHIQNMNNI
ncbi:HpcH/HpaI aldolase/citrate lyase family protein [Escherichia coli]|uniref:HpcH/HpaI aldolase/citrate lyase family protein n=1 Tax=Escherichia coli TaxID=562 RepID=UPI001F0F0361|nr:CoA ester lyase [Escherichia coli]UMS28656.1 CoA ester lyase [Escherichia coli]